jgi:hypothetical protein
MQSSGVLKRVVPTGIKGLSDLWQSDSVFVDTCDDDDRYEVAMKLTVLPTLYNRM